MKTSWTKIVGGVRESEYRVTITRVIPHRTRAWDDVVHGDSTYGEAFLGLIFGINSCVSIYQEGRLVGRKWAGRGLNSPRRVAQRMITADMVENSHQAQTYSVMCSY